MDRDLIDKIKQQTDIVAIVGEHVDLKKKGRSYWGCCPFHNEKTPSFHVEPTRQMYKCFGCGAAGDVIRFVMETKGLSFMETVEDLGLRVGITVERDEKYQRGGYSMKKSCYQAGGLAMEYYKHVLFTPHGEQALNYLKQRGMSEDTIRRFNIGYAPDSWDALIKVFNKRGMPIEAAEKCGLVVRRNNGSGYYDRFRGRVMFPIIDLSGEVIGFGGRIIGEGEPKYLNTSETPVFEKRRVLYNLQHARNDIREGGAVVVEGYMDVVSLANCGFDSAVATLGTALTEDHVRILRRFSDNITLVFDGDAAGRQAMHRAVEPFLAGDLMPRVVILPQGKDPDDVARDSIEHWNQLLDNAQNLWDFILDESFSGRDSSKLENRNLIIKELAPLISKIQDDVVRELLVERLAIRLGVEADVIRRQLKSPEAVPVNPIVTPQVSRIRDLEETLVRQMLFDESAVNAVKALDLAKEFEQSSYRELVDYLLQNGPVILEDPECPDALRVQAEKMMAEGEIEGDRKKALIDILTGVMYRTFDSEIQMLQMEITQAQDRGEQQRAMELARAKQAKILARRNINNTVSEVL